jgi:RNA polymerase sigma factor (sigma-70 family)
MPTMLSDRADGLLRHLHRLVAKQSTAHVLDEELVERFATRRDQVAFAALVRRHGPMVLSVCRRILHSAHDAEDAFQATFLVLSRKAGMLRRRGSVGNWLYGVAYRVALRARASAARRRAHESRVVQKTEPGPLGELTMREAQTILDEELAHLPERFRTPLVLCCLEGMARDEAASQLGWSPGLVKSRLEEGRRRLRDRLLRRGLTLAAALSSALLAEGLRGGMVSAALVEVTVDAATAFATGAPSAVLGTAGTAVALAEGTLQAMSGAELKTGLVVVVALAVVAAGTGLVVSSHQPAVPDERVAAPPPTVQVPVEQGEIARREAQPGALHFLDLQPLANQKLKESFGRKGNDLASLPTGKQPLGGVTFSIGEGLIQLRGHETDHPEKVEGIKVGTRFSKLYILQATQWEPETESPDQRNLLTGAYTVKYEDHSQETIPIVYGRETSNWWYHDSDSRPTAAVVAWKGTNEDAKNVSNAKIRLYTLCWQNPRPPQKVVSIDFVSTNSKAAPFCVAMTAEE